MNQVYDEILSSFTHEEIMAERCKRSFYYFVQHFWDTIIPEKPHWNWHIKYICNELQIVMERVFARQPKEYDLIINVSPGSTKSTICSEMLPAWAWCRDATIRSIVGSYAKALSLDLANRSRDIVLSEKYQKLFPHIRIRQDQQQKTHFKNRHGGERFATSTLGAVTGMHGHVIIVDDPIDPLAADALSGTNLMTCNRWLEGTLLSRAIDIGMTPMIMVMQRLHEEDPTGHFLDKKKRLKHLCFPATDDWPVKPESARKLYVNGLFDPLRMNKRVLEDKLSDLGSRKYAGQYGQQPVARGGNMFDSTLIQRVSAPPCAIKRMVRYWDKGGSQGGGCHTAGVLLGEMENGKFIVMDIVRGQWDARRREPIIKQTAEMDGKKVKIYVEQEPGSGGKESAENTITNLAGWRVYADKPSGSKDIRAEPLAVQVEQGNLYVLDREWTRDFINEIRGFPLSRQRDQVDAVSAGFNMMTSKKKRAGALRRKG